MSKIVPIRLPNNKILYMEVDEGAKSDNYLPDLPGEAAGAHSGNKQVKANSSSETVEVANEKVRDLTEILESVASIIPTAFRHATNAEIEKVTLSFGIKLGTEACIPFLTKGTAEGNIGIQIECRYPTTPIGKTSGEKN